MGLTSERYEDEARNWDENGRPEPSNVSAYHVMKLGAWMYSPGGKHDGVSQRLKDYHAALRQVLERKNRYWIDDLFDDKEYCTYCGQSWRSENCSICTYCSKSYPPCCGDKRQLKTLANGNRECSACHQGELVG